MSVSVMHVRFFARSYHFYANRTTDKFYSIRINPMNCRTVHSVWTVIHTKVQTIIQHTVSVYSQNVTEVMFCKKFYLRRLHIICVFHAFISYYIYDVLCAYSISYYHKIILAFTILSSSLMYFLFSAICCISVWCVTNNRTIFHRY